jgi:Dimerisation domain
MRNKTQKKTPVSPERLMQFGFAYAPPLIIGAGVNCKVFDTLEDGPKTLEQVGHTTGASERGLRAIMNALIGLDLLKKDRRGKYSLTPESEAFLVSNKPGTLAGFFAMAGTHLVPDWLHLSEAVRTGVPRLSAGPSKLGKRADPCAFSTSPRAPAFGESRSRSNRRSSASRPKIGRK